MPTQSITFFYNPSHDDRDLNLAALHHIVHWLHGGPTDLTNLVLLCRKHRVSRMRLRGVDVEVRVA